jgi:YesN/AraC family two-component response regulator
VRLLIIEDNANQRTLYAEEFREEYGKEAVKTASNAKVALKLIENEPPDVVILDLQMPGVDGIETLGMILDRNQKIKVIIYSGYSIYKQNFMTWAADAFLVKSSDLGELKDKVRELVGIKSEIAQS